MFGPERWDKMLLVDVIGSYGWNHRFKTIRFNRVPFYSISCFFKASMDVVSKL